MTKITLKWHKNDRMTVEWSEFQNQGFCLGSKISLHFPSFGHSIIILEWRNEVEVSRMTLEWYLSIVIFISCHSRHFEMTKEWRNEEECRCFFRGRKNWIPRYLSFFHHSIIPMSFHYISNKNWDFNLKWVWMTVKWPWKILIGCCLP